MTEPIVSGPVLIDRLRLSGEPIAWAASLVRGHEHVQLEGQWSAHQQLFHLLATERLSFQPRLRRLLAEEQPVFVSWESANYVRDHHNTSRTIDELAADFVHERQATVRVFASLEPGQWRRTGTWPDGEVVDVAWLAEKVLWHALDHLAGLLDLHGEFERRQAG